MEDIIVIGAGASGLMAARELAENDRRVTVIEARDRIGGRIHALTNFSKPAEEGAEFIHGKQPLTLKLLKEAGNKKTRVSGNYYQVWNGDLKKGDVFDDDWKQVTAELERLKADTTIADVLNRRFPPNQHAELWKKVKGFVEGYDAADMNRVSALALREEWSESDYEHQYRIEGGYSALMDLLATKVRERGGKIILSSPVREVRWRDGAVKVITADGNRVEAQKAVITLPLGILQKNLVTFSPTVPELDATSRALGVGGVIKFLFEFQSGFWEDVIARKFKKLAFVFSDAEVPTWWSQRPDDIPLLTGWLGGPSTAAVDPDKEALCYKAILSLQYIFKCDRADIEKNIVQRHIADWSRDVFAFGAYSYPTVQTTQALKLLSKPFGNALYFAGEHLYKGPAMGTVEAALFSGKEVAAKIG